MRRLVLVVAVLMLVCPALEAQESRDSSSTSNARPTAPGGLRLVNPTSMALKVEIRLTTARGCDGPVLTTTTVAPNAATRISLGEAVCIRREELIEGTPTFRITWERKEVTRGAVTEVRL